MTERPDYPLGRGSVDETPWPGREAAGSHPIARGVSGQIVLEFQGGEVSTLLERRAWNHVVLWRSEEPAPCVLHLRCIPVESPPPQFSYAVESFFPTQLSCAEDVDSPGGAVQITYGMGHVQRVIECDIKSGAYQLPPCDSVSIAARVYGSGAPQMLSAAIVPGRTDQSARLTSTWTPCNMGPGSRVEYPPSGARWVSLQSTGIGEGAPKLKIEQSGAWLIVQDYATPFFLPAPGQPVELLTRTPILLWNFGTYSAEKCVVKFFLEP
jgi:hypothetical protein